MQTAINVAVAYLVLTWLIVALRMWVRCGMLKKPSWGDLMILIAQVSQRPEN